MPPHWRNQRAPTAGDTPAATADFSLDSPRATSSQNLCRCSRRPTVGRPGEHIGGRKARSDRRRLLAAIATPPLFLRCCDDLLNPPTTPRRFETIHDVLLFYAKGNEPYFKQLKLPHTKEHVNTRYVQEPGGRYKFTTGGNILTGPEVVREGDSGKPWRGFDPTAKGRHWAIPGYLAQQMPEGFGELESTEKA